MNKITKIELRQQWILDHVVKQPDPLGRHCKDCKYKKDCGGFRDRNNRCPEGMAGITDRWTRK